jgi:hypothetical protein
MVVWPVLALFLLTALYLQQRNTTGWPGLTGYVLNFFGFAFFLALETANWIILPLLPEGTRDEILAGPAGLFFRITAVTMILGVVLFGTTTMRADVVPTAAALLYTIGLAVFVLAPFLPPAGHIVNHLVVSAALVWIGAVLWSLPRPAHPAHQQPRSRSTPPER